MRRLSKIKALTDLRYSLNGYQPILVREGDEVSVPDHIADEWVKLKKAVSLKGAAVKEGKMAPSAPENKSR